MTDVLLTVRGLTTTIASAASTHRGLDDVSFSIARGQALGVVGESGSGKSMLALAIMGLLPRAIRVVSGSVNLGGQELLMLGEKGMRRLRGARLGLVFQEPMTALNPLQSIGSQVAEALVVHGRASRGEALREAVAVLDRVGIPDAARRVGEFPHRLSGGLRQRVVIAMALACGPDFLIADEPTTALDVTIQAQILDLLADLRRERNLAVMLISHDLEMVAGFADRVVVMYAGRVVENGPARETLTAPLHPYTKALLSSVPRIDQDLPRLPAIEGMVPQLDALPAGCAFHPRCGQAIEPCRLTVPALPDDTARGAACLLAKESATA